MSALQNAPGVISIPTRIFVRIEDVMMILGCKKTKASECIRKTNAKAESEGKLAFTQGKANKYIFAELFDIPVEEINKVLDYNSERRG
ncbi:MAG: hypothetical protein J5943_03260 [Oribacterium sp.]|nr:hypothetical protein [Oribacterium sp.]